MFLARVGEGYLLMKEGRVYPPMTPKEQELLCKPCAGYQFNVSDTREHPLSRNACPSRGRPLFLKPVYSQHSETVGNWVWGEGIRSWKQEASEMFRHE